SEPLWWPLWYLPALRRRGNVWDRLPTSVRQVRTWPAAFIALGFLGQSDALLKLLDWRRVPVSLHLGLVGGLTVLFVLWYLMLMRSRRQLEARGLEPADAARVVLAVPASRTSFWSRPHIAAILAPAPRAEAARRTQSRYEQFQSIWRNADELSGSLRPLGAQAAIAARQLLVSIEHADRQVADLARSLDPGEEERLADKVAALGAASTEVRQLL